MTKEEGKKVFDRFVNETTAFMIGATPFRTGRMMNEARSYLIPNGVAIEWTTPYVVYTVEPWYSPRWRGRENPNLQWIKKAMELCLRNLGAGYGGKYYEL